MGFGGINIWQLLIILVIVLLLFGTKRLRNLGQDLGSAVRGFRSSMKDAEDEEDGESTSERLEEDETGKRTDADFDKSEEDRQR